MRPVETDLWKARDVARLLSLVEAERRYFQELLAAIPVPIAVVANDCSLSSCNHAFLELFGLRAGEQAVALTHWLTAPPVQEVIKQVLTTRKPADSRLRFGGFDLTVTIEAIRHWDEDDVCLSFRPTVQERFLAAPAPEESAVRPAAGIPAAWTAEAETLQVLTMQRGALPVSETAWCEGADLSARSIVPEDQPAVREFYAALADGQPLVTCDYSAKAADGSILLLRDAAQLVPSGSRAVLHGFTFDITAAHTAEQQRAQAQRIDALTRMASRLVHDSNNLMMVMSGYGEDLLHALPPESPLRVNVREILAAGERVAVFTRQLSAFTRRAPASIAPVTADDLLNDIGELARTLPRGVTLSASAPGPTATALADRKRLLDVVEALVQRAASGLPNGGEVSILVAIRQGSHFAAAGQSFHTAIPHVCIEIHDSGIAIYPTVLSRIFEPDASSDPVRQKLAPAYQTIREMGGDIEVSPSTPAGTTFRIVLPLATVKGEERPGEAGSGIAEPATDTGAPKTTVLVVDDEAGIRSLLSKVFLREGYEVLEAVQGRDGLDLARSYQGKIDLLLTDVVMPTMNGIELAQSVHAIRPSTKILLISGYMGGSAREFEKLPAGTAFLQKPFTLNALLAKVREVVSANSQAASA